MNTDLLLNNIQKHIVLRDEEREFILSLFNSRTIKRKEFLLKEGEPCATFNYVLSGALRSYYRDADDKETTQMFAVADWWITDMPCFVNELNAMVNIEAISDTSVLTITKSNLDLLLIQMPKFERFLRIIMQNAYVREQLRAIHLLSQPAEVRYNNFIKQYPSIFNQVTQKNIASYLGVTPEFLSAIRSKGRRKPIS